MLFTRKGGPCRCANPGLVERAASANIVRVWAIPQLTRSITLLLCALLLAPAVATQTPGEPPVPVFEFHSGFWINLHHFLYQQARQQSQGTRATGKTAAPPKAVTISTLLDMKRKGVKIAMLTAYDYPAARLAEEAGVDVILVGDSVGMKKLCW